ncbi:MAG: hypothetical protein J6T81_06225 [Bacteroidales bacterium]|nr:hypothetical protein [Bacteroidales bacterium]
MKELKETAEMMCSPDYKERFKAELYQLKTRYRKLEEMIKKWDDGRLDFEPTCPHQTYDLQLRAMRDYLSILVIRARIEGIELD